MVLQCEHGHDIDIDTNKCSEGHPPQLMATTPSVINVTPQQLQEIVQGAITGALAAQQHALAAQQQAPTSQQQANPPSHQLQQHANVKKPERPEIDLESNESQWAFFMYEWERYKRQAHLAATDVNDELKSACSAALRKELFDFVGPTTLDTLNEERLLEKIKSLAIKGKNKAVHRQEFYAMSQSPGQPIQAFVAQLRSKAEPCQFTFKCISNACDHQLNSYTEAMVCDQMVVGCCDSDIQEETLAKDSQLPTLQDKFDLIQAREEGKRARSQLCSDSSITTQKSQYRRDQTHAKVNVSNATRQNIKLGCSGCGSKCHGQGTGLARSVHCPAKDKMCDYCNIPGHLSTVCRKKSNPAYQPHPKDKEHKSGHNMVGSECESDNTSCFFTQHAASSSLHKQEHAFSRKLQADNRLAWKQRNPSAKVHLDRKVIIPHMEWSEEYGRFLNSSPRALPQLKVALSVLHSAHQDFNKDIPVSMLGTITNGSSINAYADTGAQTCASGPDILRILNIDEKYLIPTSHKIVGVTQSRMDIMGVLLLEIAAKGRFSNQVVYISNNIQGFFLSEQSQIDLGIVPSTFPTADTFPSEKSVHAACSSERATCNEMASCGCPKRTIPPPKPSQLPFPPTPENRAKFESWLFDYYGSSAFNTCEHQPLPKMTGKPLDIHFRPDSKPKAFHCPIPVPHHWKEQVKANLDRDVRLGIIEPVPPGTPTVWCSKMVVVPKKDGTPRRTVDLQHLNNATFRETHHTPSPFNQASVVPPHTKKTVLDAWNGYHSLALSPNASDATTFITEWGRYRYLSSPQGFHAAGDAYTRSFDDITVDFRQKAKCIDDSLLWDSSLEEAFWHTVDYITQCNKNGIIFNPTKFHFAMDEVDFAGFTITSTGIKPMQQILTAISNFPTPTDITGARSWFGLVNQVAYAFSMAEEMLPYRDLLKRGAKWYWDDTLNNLFEKSKRVIVKLVEKGVCSFQIGRPTCLATDWSKDGVGFVLLQKFCKCAMDKAPYCCSDGWHLIFAGSRFTSDAESRYAPVEGEALAVVNALEKCRMFVLGCSDLLVVVDHKPLVKILGDRSLEDIKNPRLFNLKEKTLMFKYAIKHVPGTWHLGPDACSRYPATSTSPVAQMSSILPLLQEPITSHDVESSLELDLQVESAVLAAMSGSGYTDGIDIRAITLDRVKEVAANDDEIQGLIKTILDEFPSCKEDLPTSLQPYWNIQNELSCIDGVAL